MNSKNILITGGSGSFGNAFVEHLLKSAEPQRIVIYSRDEHKQDAMARKFTDPRLRFFIGDVRSPSRLEMALRDIDTVVHAAAMKIVPIAEYNPTECIATNIGGAENVIRASLRTGVRKVLALSTDKAVNPINLYGATKLAAEKAFIAANALAAGRCAFSVMRYGNVVGSNGSVVPVFRNLLAAGKPLTITDSRMTRFWITMDQAVQFASKCLERMQGREIYIPKIPSVRIMDILLAMDGDSGKCEIIGIRPGEKLHETLISEEETAYLKENEEYFAIFPHHTGPSRGNWHPWSYRSDKNVFLTIDQIRESLGDKAPDQTRDSSDREDQGQKQQAMDATSSIGDGVIPD